MAAAATTTSTVFTRVPVVAACRVAVRRATGWRPGPPPGWSPVRLVAGSDPSAMTTTVPYTVRSATASRAAVASAYRCVPKGLPGRSARAVAAGRPAHAERQVAQRGAGGGAGPRPAERRRSGGGRRAPGVRGSPRPQPRSPAAPQCRRLAARRPRVPVPRPEPRRPGVPGRRRAAGPPASGRRVGAQAGAAVGRRRTRESRTGCARPGAGARRLPGGLGDAVRCAVGPRPRTAITAAPGFPVQRSLSGPAPVEMRRSGLRALTRVSAPPTGDRSDHSRVNLLEMRSN